MDWADAANCETFGGGGGLGRGGSSDASYLVADLSRTAHQQIPLTGATSPKQLIVCSPGAVHVLKPSQREPSWSTPRPLLHFPAARL